MTDLRQSTPKNQRVLRVVRGLALCVLGLLLAAPIHYPELAECLKPFPPAVPGLYNAVVMVASITLFFMGVAKIFRS